MTGLDGIFADFVDGESAHWQRVGLGLVPGNTAPTDLRLTLADGSRLYWPLEKIRRQPDQAARDAAVLSMTDAPMMRLHLKGREAIAQIERHASALDRRPKPANRRRLAAWSLAALVSVAAIIFGLVPLMANQLAAYLPPEGEKALGDATFAQIRSVLDDGGSGGIRICDDSDGVAALDKIATRLNAAPDLPYPVEVHVLDHELINAFALPGGHVVFFRGLIEEAESPEEVAAVFAHELGHVVGRDPTRDALRSAGSIGVLGLLFGDFAGGTAVLFLANQLINASYSRSAEAGADAYAHGLMRGAGLSPAALGTFFERLNARYGDAEGIMAHFASHPQMLDRIAAAQAAGEGIERTEPLLSAAEWSALRGICGDNPVVGQPGKGQGGGWLTGK